VRIASARDSQSVVKSQTAGCVANYPVVLEGLTIPDELADGPEVEGIDGGGRGETEVLCTRREEECT
jgi:hypothetical protein